MSLPEEVSAHLDGALGSIGGALTADPGAGVRWTPRSQRHLTLAFHGTVPDGSVSDYLAALTAAVSEQAIEPFDVALAGGGSFSGRTLWVGVGDGADRIRELSTLASGAAAEIGWLCDKRAGSRPHLTVARASAHRGPDRRGARRRDEWRRGGTTAPKGAVGQRGPTELAVLDAWARAFAVYRGPVWTAERLQVFESALGEGPGGGPRHTELASVAFGG